MMPRPVDPNGNPLHMAPAPPMQCATGPDTSALQQAPPPTPCLGPSLFPVPPQSMPAQGTGTFSVPLQMPQPQPHPHVAPQQQPIPTMGAHVGAAQPAGLQLVALGPGDAGPATAPQKRAPPKRKKTDAANTAVMAMNAVPGTPGPEFVGNQPYPTRGDTISGSHMKHLADEDVQKILDGIEGDEFNDVVQRGLTTAEKMDGCSPVELHSARVSVTLCWGCA